MVSRHTSLLGGYKAEPPQHYTLSPHTHILDQLPSTSHPNPLTVPSLLNPLTDSYDQAWNEYVWQPAVPCSLVQCCQIWLDKKHQLLAAFNGGRSQFYSCVLMFHFFFFLLCCFWFIIQCPFIYLLSHSLMCTVSSPVRWGRVFALAQQHVHRTQQCDDTQYSSSVVTGGSSCDISQAAEWSSTEGAGWMTGAASAPQHSCPTPPFQLCFSLQFIIRIIVTSNFVALYLIWFVKAVRCDMHVGTAAAVANVFISLTKKKKTQRFKVLQPVYCCSTPEGRGLCEIPGHCRTQGVKRCNLLLWWGRIAYPCSFPPFVFSCNIHRAVVSPRPRVHFHVRAVIKYAGEEFA